MNAYDRRRVVAAAVFTLVALPALWALGRESAAHSKSPTVGAAGVDVGTIGHGTPPPTSAYKPEPPGFVGGDQSVIAPGVVDVAVPPAPSKNQLVGRATFHRYSTDVGTPIAGSGATPGATVAPGTTVLKGAAGTTNRLCTTMLVPDGTLLMVTNLDNGQSTTCTNTYGLAVPAGADIVLDTALLAEISNLTDAPVPVRVNW